MIRAALVLLALSVGAPAWASPLLLSHQGRMLDANADPLEGAHQVTFSLYDAATGGTAVWTDTFAVDFSNGYFAVILGSRQVAPLSDDDFTTWPLWLGMTVAGGTELAPRQEVVSVPFAVHARTSTNVKGGTVDATSVVVGGVTVIDGSGNVTATTLDAGEIRVDGGTVIDGAGNFTGGSVDATSLSIGGDTVIDGGGNFTGGSVDATSLSIGGTTVLDGSRNLTVGGIAADSLSIGGHTVIDGSGSFVGSVGTAALDGLGCAVGQYPVRRASGWTCEAAVVDTTLSSTTVRQYVTSSAIGLAAGSTVGGKGIMTQWSDLTPPADLADGDDDVLGKLGCGANTYAVHTAGGWTCADVVVNTDSDTLATLGCSNGDLVALESGDWTCVSSLDVVSIAAGQVVADQVDALTATVSGALFLGQESDAFCTGDHTGALVFDQSASVLKVCTTSGWVTVGTHYIIEVQGARRWSDGKYAAACWDYKNPTDGSRQYAGATGDGVYTIDPDGAGVVAPFDVYCEMTTDGGGWTLVDNSTASGFITSRTAGANTSLSVTKGSYLPAYTWSGDPKLLCKSSYYTGSLPWLTLKATSATGLEYPTKTTQSGSHSGAWAAGTLNGNTNQGVDSWIYVHDSRFGTVWIGNGGQPTCACDYIGNETGLGGYTTAASATCSTYVR